MPPKHNFTVIEGGTGGLVRTGILAPDGQEYFKGGGGQGGGHGGSNDNDSGGGGGMTPIWRLDIPRDVQIVKWGLAGLVTLLGLFFFTLYQPDMKDLRKDLGEVKAAAAAQAATSVSMQATLARIEDRVERRDDQSQRSTGARPARPVR